MKKTIQLLVAFLMLQMVLQAQTMPKPKRGYNVGTNTVGGKRIFPDLPKTEMVFVQGGTFTMGCTDEQGSDCESDEKPAHQVKVSDYYIGKYEVTQGL